MLNKIKKKSNPMHPMACADEIKDKVFVKKYFFLLIIY